jgi:hypothetical protein
VGVFRDARSLAPRFLRGHRELFNLKLLKFVASGHLINAIAQLFNALGMTEGRLSIFIFGLLWLLFHGAFQFWSNSVCSTPAGGALSREPDSK